MSEKDFRQDDTSAPGTSDSRTARLGDAGSGSYGSSADEPTRVTGSASGADSGPPQIVGYQIHERIHRGGQGVVFRATQLTTKRSVALKVLLEGEYASDTARHRFDREVELAASLVHPNIVTILDSGVSGGRCYFAMEFIEGVRLDHYLNQKRPGLRETLQLLQRICETINFAHQRGVIHRDLKPSNILVTEEGQPSILDFGLAKARRGPNAQETTIQALSMTGQVIGTLAYMSPEQAAGSVDVDVRSDVYSLGVLAYESLLGRAPYPVNGPLGEVLNRITNQDPLRPRSIRSTSRFGRQIDDELETILLKALEKDPERRYQTAGDLARDFEHYLSGEPVEAKRASGLYMIKKTLRRYRLQAATGAVILAMLVTFLIVFAVQYRRERDLREQAEQLQVAATAAASKAQDAERRERLAREQAEQDKLRALEAAAERRRALIAQEIQRGELALLRDNPADARDCFWNAFNDAPDDPAALWALRQYYLQTGDDGAKQLYTQSDLPVALSPRGRLVAVCESPRSITLRDWDSGKCLAWYATPADLQTVSVDDAGRVCAVGPTWARVWELADARPSTVVELDRPMSSQSVALLGDGAYLVIVSASEVRAFRCANPGIGLKCRLKGSPVGASVLSPTFDRLAIPTTAGTELVALADDGELTSQVVLEADVSGTPRALQFLDENTIAVLANVVHFVQLDGPQPVVSQLLSVPTASWDLFDVTADGKTITFGSLDGRAAIYQDGKLQRRWRITQGGLKALQLSPAGNTIVTLDDRGALTRWGAEGRAEQSRRLLGRPVARWAVSEDGSTVLMSDANARLTVYSPRRSTDTKSVEWPTAMRIFGGRRIEQTHLALDGDGSHAALAYGIRVWVKDLWQGRSVLLPIRELGGMRVEGLALSSDASLLAVHGTRGPQRRHFVYLLPLDRYVNASGHSGRQKTAQSVLVGDFLGAGVTQVVFLPHTNKLLIARDNGELLVRTVDDEIADAPRGEPPAGTTAPPWLALDSAANLLAVDRAGQRVAAMCDDGFVRIVSVPDAQVTGTLHIGQTVASLAFNPTGDVLLVRSDDGVLSMYTLDTLARITHWQLAEADERAMGVWIGDDDALLVAQGRMVHELRPAAVDTLIDDNRSNAIQRRIARALSDHDYQTAWQESHRLESLNDELALDAQAVILDQVLRRPRARIPASWIKRLQADGSPLTELRLGHAAHAGGRFALARGFFQDAAHVLDERLDAYTQWKRLECEYLLGDPTTTADQLGELLYRDELDDADVPRVFLQWLGALALADRQSEIREILRGAISHPRLRRMAPSAAMTAAQMVGHTLADEESGQSTSIQLRSILGRFEGLTVPYLDDIEFFSGELSRKWGDIDAARASYERCIDVAADEWPANWAALRLRQIASQ